MTSDAQNKAIAIACGWTLRQRVFHNERWHDVPTWFAPEFKDYPADRCPAGQWLGGGVPCYHRDLNCMHKAEKILDEDQADQYMSYLSGIVATESIHWNPHDWSLTHATAAQRAEAFLKCLRLWSDAEEPHTNSTCT